MDFDAFLESVSKIKNIPLPGEASHFKMIPAYRLKFMKMQGQDLKTARQSAVLSLFYPDDRHQTKIALILRKSYRGVHSAQIGLPGGKAEPEDPHLLYTALRETYEEIGVKPKHIKVLKKLTEVYIPPSNFRVQPFVGTTDRLPNFALQEDEVEDLLQVPLDEFLTDHNVKSQYVRTSFNARIEVPAFTFQGHVVWGATAMMLSELKDLIKMAL